jgi:PKD repeat protein
MKKSLFFIFLGYTALFAQAPIRYDYQVPMGRKAPGLPQYGDSLQFQFNFDGQDMRIDTALYPVRFSVSHSSVCDTSGNLLLYTNGESVLNGLNEIIEGGDTLQLHADSLFYWGFDFLIQSIPQGALLLPNPAMNGIYYLFHEEYQRLYDWTLGQKRFRIPKIYLTTIDMHQNNGRGKIIEKNKVIAERDSLFGIGRILSVRHANGRDWWVVVPQNGGNRFTKFLVTPDGVQTQPDIVVEQSYLPMLGEPIQAAFSPDGTKYATTGHYFESSDPYNIIRCYYYLYDFDRCTGTLYNQFIGEQTESEFFFGIFFSPDSRYLYWIHRDSSDITQFDLRDPNWYEHGELVYEWEGFNFPFPTAPAYAWNGPDGRIYISCGNGVKVIHRINSPNERGAACRFERNIEVPGINYVTLPNIPNYRLGPMDGSACDTLGINNNPMARWRWELDTGTVAMTDVRFTDLSYFEPDTWIWNFGDGTTSQDTSPVHLFPYPDTFTVCLTVSNQYSSSTYCAEVVAGQVSGTGEPTSYWRSRMQLHPNPASTAVQVNLAVPDHFTGQLHVLDILGRTVTTQSVQAQQQVTVPTADWQRGVYICVLKDREGRVQDVARLLIH